MKRIFLIISFMCSICVMSAQTTLKCVYQEKYIKNANQPDKFSYDEHVLVISGNRSAYYSRNARLRSEMKDSLLKQGLSSAEIIGAIQATPKGRELEIYKNQPINGKYLHYDKNTKLFRYEDELPKIAWETGEEVKSILGYQCQKATGSLYGREWTVWFTMDIPVSDGPWLLCGLPGLILEATDGDNIFHFTTVELSNNASISVEPTNKKYIKCTREEYLTQRAKFEEDPLGMLQKTMGIKVMKVRDANGQTVTTQQIKNNRKTNYYEK